jgi:succinate dehydrogenase hydrophobic anchor subunit
MLSQDDVSKVVSFWDKWLSGQGTAVVVALIVIAFLGYMWIESEKQNGDLVEKLVSCQADRAKEIQEMYKELIGK